VLYAKLTVDDKSGERFKVIVAHFKALFRFLPGGNKRQPCKLYFQSGSRSLAGIELRIS
jgi:hypothetical protein